MKLSGLAGEGIAEHEEELMWFWMNFGEVPALASNEWEFRTGYWAWEGMTGKNAVTKERFHLSMETPLAAWQVRNAVELPGNQVLFQLGMNQICLLEANGRRIGITARGSGPAVLMDTQKKLEPKEPGRLTVK